MPLPEAIRVRLSSEEAGSVSITPVVMRDMPLRELIEIMLGITGKDAPRIRELLLCGTFVSGSSRLRWAGWEADKGAIEEMLASFPASDPARPFAPDRCVRAVFHGPGCRIELRRETGLERRLLRRKSFWHALLGVLATERPRYVQYSYKERGDCYRLELSGAACSRLRGSAGLLRYSSLENRIRHSTFEFLDLYVERLPG